MITLVYFKTISTYWEPPEITYYKAYIDDFCQKNECKLISFRYIPGTLTVRNSSMLQTKVELNDILKLKTTTILTEQEWKEEFSKRLEWFKNLG